MCSTDAEHLEVYGVKHALEPSCQRVDGQLWDVEQLLCGDVALRCRQVRQAGTSRLYANHKAACAWVQCRNVQHPTGALEAGVVLQTLLLRSRALNRLYKASISSWLTVFGRTHRKSSVGLQSLASWLCNVLLTHICRAARHCSGIGPEVPHLLPVCAMSSSMSYCVSPKLMACGAAHQM